MQPPRDLITTERARLAAPSMDGYHENARIKGLMELDASEARLDLQDRAVAQPVDPRLAGLAAQAGRLMARQRSGYSATRAKLISGLLAQYDAIRAGETA